MATKTATLLNEVVVMSEKSASPLVFISHDSRDAELAAAFEKLLKSVSAGMIKTFRSSDKKPGEGKSGDADTVRGEMERLHRFSDFMMRGPFMDELGYSGKEAYMFIVELPHMLERALLRSSMKKKSPTRANQRKSV